jgi:pyruvate formate lyase activating enzyme
MGGEGVSIKGFIESSFLDWPGKVAAVLFLPGCNLRCPYCHNHDLIINPQYFEDIPLDQVFGSLHENEGWVDGVVVTGGEPTLNVGLFHLLERLQERGLPVKLDTNGTRPNIIKELIKQELVSAVAMDVKAELLPEAYSHAAGVYVDVGDIAESIRTVAESGVESFFRTTVVPVLHDEYSVRSIRAELYGRPLILQNFRPVDALDPAYRDIKQFPPLEFRALCAAAGMV